MRLKTLSEKLREVAERLALSAQVDDAETCLEAAKVLEALYKILRGTK